MIFAFIPNQFFFKPISLNDDVLFVPSRKIKLKKRQPKVIGLGKRRKTKREKVALG